MYVTCVCLRIVVSNTCCVVFFCFVFLRLVANFSGWSIFDCPFNSKIQKSETSDKSLTWISWKTVCYVNPVLLHPFDLFVPNCLQQLSSYLAFQYCNFECTWWRLFSQRVLCSKLEFNVFIIIYIMTRTTIDLYSLLT